MKLLIKILLILFTMQNCSELSFRSDPLSMTMVKYENRSSNRYIFLAHEGDDCHLLRHKRIHNFFFLFPLNSFSKHEIQEISQQKMIRYKNIMRLGDFAWTLFLLPLTVITYSIEVETCNTGMVAVTRRDPLYLESIKMNKKNPSNEPELAQLDTKSKTKERKTYSEIPKKSINPKPEQESEEVEEQPEIDSPPPIQKEKKRKLRYKEKPPGESAWQGEENSSDSDQEHDLNTQESVETLPPEEVWNSAKVTNEPALDETTEPFNSEVYKLDGTLPIIWNYKNSITNKINENVKPFSILFPKNGVKLSTWEEKKLDAFADEYLESYGTSKILLIGHSEWANGKGTTVTLSQLRAEAVREYLINKSISPEKILLSFSGGLWGEVNEAKFGKQFSRRVDIVFLY